MTRTFCDICGEEGPVRTLTDIHPYQDERVFVDICEDCVELKKSGKLREFMRFTKETM